MKSRPILFSAPMVRALLAGKKTQTRRIVKPTDRRPVDFLGSNQADQNNPKCWGFIDGATDRSVVLAVDPADDWTAQYPCPYGAPGDQLWVREAWQSFFDDEVPADRPRGPQHTMGIPAYPWRKSFVFYRADGDGPRHPDGAAARWASPLHLPHKYSRITLDVVGIRVERLQDISESDAIAEGLTQTARGAWLPGPCDHPEWAYHQLWEQINGPGSWDANPWVWVIQFKRTEGGAA